MSKPQKAELFTDVVLEVFKLGGLLVGEGDQMGAEYNVTSARWKILGALFLAGEPQTVPQIAKTMGLTRQAVQRLVDAMQKDGFLVFNLNPFHKRAKLIGLSEQGKDIYVRLYEKNLEWAAECSKEVSQEELETTLSVMRRVCNAIDR